MKGKRFLILGGISGLAMGWALGFLRLPMIGQKDSFWVGFVAALAVAAFVFALLYLIGRKSVLDRHKANEQASPKRPILGMLLALVVLGNCLFAGYVLHRQTNLFAAQTTQKNALIQEQNELIASLRNSKQGSLISNLLERIDEELKQNENGVLNAATIAEVAALSKSCQPYQYEQGDSLSPDKLSPERGQLLLALVFRPLDSTTFAQIKAQATFAGADLQGVALRNADLRGADLENANLKDAELQGALFGKANLRRANLWGAKLDSANLQQADLVRAQLNWATLNGSHLNQANLDGANLSNAQLRGVSAMQATFQWATLDQALCMNSDFDQANFFGGHLAQTNFSQSQLSRTDLRKAVWDEANLSQTKLDAATVRKKDWLETLDQWQMTGVESFPATYEVVEDTSGRFKYADWCLKKK